MINLKKDDAVADAIREILQQEALKGDQHKIDANKNNKIDAHDFKLLRGKKKDVDEEVKDEYARKVDKYLKKKYNKEEVETVEEGLQQTLRKYVPGYAKAQLNKKMDAQNYASGDSTKKTVDKDVNYNRYKKVADKLNKEEVELDEEAMKDCYDCGVREAKKEMKTGISSKSKYEKGTAEYKESLLGYNSVMKNEEVEQIDELSKSTLGSYTKKASLDATITRKIGADFENNAKRSRSPGMKAAANSLSDMYKSKSWKRKAGIDKAVDRLTKEDVEGVKLKTLSQFKEGWSEMMADVRKRAEPQPSGGAGIKQGSRYGGGKQKPEKPDEEKKK